MTVAEGFSTSSAVYTVTAVEPGGAALNYSLSGTDAAAFNINAATGAITFVNSPNFEAKTSYSITVKATETSGLSTTQAVTINITDVAPTISSPSSVSIPEGVSTSTVVYLAQASEPGGAALTYSLSGTDAASFNINAATGAITFVNSPNFEVKASYSITVKATETSGLFATQAVTINITDVAPTISSGASVSVAEGTSTSTAVYTVSALEPGGAALTYSIVAGGDSASFNINAATGAVTFVTSPNFEAKSSYSITVKATETSGLFATKAVTINITDVAPTFSSPSSVSIPEGVSTSTVVYLAQASEPGGAALTYSLSGTDAAAFNINAATGAITFVNSPNFEAKTSYSITVKATETSGLSTTQAVTINITDVAPTISSPSSVSIPEGVSTSTVVYLAQASEPGGAALTYSLSGTDAASFNINAATGAITFVNSPNFEVKASYSITVKATETSGLFATQAVTINITDVAPTISSGASVSVAEGTSTSTAVYTVSALEPGGAALTYSIVAGGDSASFNINAATGAVTFVTSPNFEAKSSYSITVKATETSGLFATKAVTINITDVAPTISSPSSVSIPEGVSTSTVVYLAQASEPGGATLTYSLSGTDAAAFNINAATGAITFVNSPNFEAKSSYSITVKATETSGLFTTQAVAINIADVAPTISSPSSVSVAEGTSTSTVVYTVSALEPGGAALTYSLSGTDAASFNINASTGAITFVNSPNFEAKTSYSITVKATEISGLSATQAVTINITDVAPTISSPSSVSIPEGVSTSTVVYLAQASEPGGAALTYSLSGTDAASFNINAATGAITFVNSPNFEAKTSYSITVKATETSGLFTTQAVTINITDVGPTISSGASVSVAEGTSTSTAVYTVSALEPGGAALTYSIVAGGDSASFNINAATGVITFINPPNFEAKSSYSITVKATEISGLFATKAVTINITDVAPTISSPSSVSIPEGVSTSTVVYLAQASEPGGAALTYSLSGTDAASFNINAATGAITFINSPNFEAKSSYSITIKATETSGLFTTQAVAINIADVAPTISSPSSVSVAEGTSTSTVVYTVSALEPGGAALTYSLSGTDAASFNINASTGAITFVNSPNFEAKSSYSITVKATEISGLSATQAVTINITDVGPTIYSPSSVSISEGVSTSTVVYLAQASEPGGAALTYSLSGTDAASFNINAATGAITFINSPNFEAKSSYSITVKATEASGLFTTQAVAINITDVAPTFSSPSSVSIPEGVSTSTVVYLAQASEPGGATLTYSLSGTDAAAFNINAATGAITFVNSPNFEAKSSYSITVKATETSGLFTTQAVAINIADVAPTISSPSSVSVAEGTSTSTVVYTVSALEPGGAALTYSLSGTDAASFNINASTGAITFVNSPNFEAKTSYSITVKATEISGLSATQAVTINITDVAPTISSPSSVSIPEGVSTSTVVYLAQASEPGGAALTYSLSGTDAASFNINAATGAITFVNSPNFEAKTSYSITVKATETSGLFTTQAVTINITDVGPTISSGTSVSVAEGTSTSTAVYTVSALEPGGAALTYSIVAGGDSAAFNINAATGAITFINPPNFEAKSSYSITVKAAEASGLSATQAVTINITDVAPTISSPSSVSIPEGVSTSTVVYLAQASEPGGAALTYSLSGTDAASFNINAATGAITFVNSPNFEAKTSYSFTVKATETSGLFATQAVTINITDVGPTISSGTSVSVAEGTSTSTAVYTVSALEPGGAALTYSVVAGGDSAAFNINAATGAITFINPPNFEAKSSYSITVKATETSGLSATQAVTINITDVAPTISSPTSVSVAEGISTSTIVYTVSAIEPGGAALTYSLSGTDAAAFNINAATGAITFINPPNFEAKTSYNITVKASEVSGLSTSQAVTINITDVAPTFYSPSTVSIPEGVATSTVVYLAQASEPGGAALTYSLSGTDAASFNINAATGAITFINSPNFEAKTSYSITVKASETSGLFTTQAVTINITDVGPAFSSPSAVSIPEGISTSTVVYTASAIEPGGAALTYSLSGTDAASFNINAATGAITFVNSPNFEAKTSYSITVKATETSGLFATQAVTINITDVAPTISSPTSVSVAEGTATSTVVYLAQASEPGGAALTYSLSGTDAASFNINAVTGAITFINSPNFEAKSSYSITVKATETSGLFATQTVTINIIDVAPTISSPTSISVAEGTATSTVVYTVSAIEPGGAALTYSLSGTDAAAFNINAATGAITFINSPNFEAKSSYSITVKATETSGLFTTQTVTINITDAAPTIYSPTSISVAEGTATSTVIYLVQASEPGGAALTYSLSGTDAASFSINAATGAITFINSPNFEAKSSYSITVKATETSGLFTTQAVTINITDVGPTFSSPSAVSVPEGISTSTVVYTASAIEPGGAVLTYSVSGTDAAAFNINAVTGAITFINSPNFEAKSSYSITVKATETSGLFTTQAVTINIADVAPIISSPTSVSVAEGISTSTVVYTVSAIEPGGAALTYSLSGTDAAAFNINAATGAITFINSPNFEAKTSYNITVKATEASGLFATQTVVVNITDVGPTFSSGTSVSVAEGISTSTVVYMAQAGEPGGAALTYSLSGTDAAAFNINASTGAITFINSPNFEAKTSYSITVKATEASGLFATQAVVVNITDVGPTFSSGTSVAVAEGTSTSTVVYSAAAIEPGGAALTYSISGTDAASFNINASTGAITFVNSPNFEAKSSYSIAVTATEASGLFATQTVLVNITDVGPTFSSGTSVAVAEGTSSSTVVYLAQASEPGGAALTYSLSGTDAAAFNINASTGAITFINPPNFEAKSSYSVSVKATEASGLFTTQAVTINITDVGPSIFSPTSISVAEGTATSTVVYLAQASEPGGAAVTYSISGTDAAAFNVNASTGEITFINSPNFEAKSSYSITVKATETSGLFTTQAVTINITDVAPTFSSATSVTVAEGTATSTAFYIAQAIEPGGAALTYTLSGADAAAFNINASTGAITFINSPNYEAKSTYNINVTATETSGLFATQGVTIHITDVAPTFSSPTSISIAEGTATSTVIYSAQAIEPGGAALTYSLSGADAAAFNINASTGAITFINSPNYEAKSAYNITVKATETSGLFTTQAVTVNITDVAPIFSSGTSTFVAEGTSTSTVVYTASAIEPGGTALTYSLSGTDAAAFNINAATGAVTFVNSPNFEAKSSYSITVKATEASGLFSTQAVTVNITDVAPAFSSASTVSIPEGVSTSTVVYLAQANEPGGGAIAYSLTGADAAAFNINASTGVITFINSPNYEAKSSYNINVTATETSGLFTTQAVTINVTDVGPTLYSPSVISIPEGTSTSTVAYLVQASEPGGGALTYSLSGSDAAAFNINAATGAVTFVNSPNFEAKSSYNVNVTATEASGLFTTQAVTINITDVGPTFSSPTSISVAEGTSPSTVVYTASAIEPGGAALTYSLSGTDAAAFNINAATGAVSFVNSPNFEAKSSYNVNVTATEASGLFATQAVSIQITDVGPTFSSSHSITVAEGTATTTIIYTAVATEPGGAALTYSLSGTDAAAFNINAATGAVSFVNSPNFEAKSSYNVNVTATEASGLFTTQAVTINISDVAPTFSSGTSASVTEGISTSTVVYTAAAIEPGGAALTYSLSGTDASAFNINASTGAITFINSPNFEAKSSYNINVTATEVSGLFTSQAVTINVTDAAPTFSSGTSTSVAEGTATTTVVYLAQASEPGGAALTYSLSGTDASAFNINAATGAITFINSPNFEAKSTYNINVTATETSGLFTTQPVTVNITDVAPTFSSGTSVSVAEGTASSTVIYLAQASEPGGAALTYSLSGTDASAFNINAATGAISFINPPNFEAKSSYNVNVTATETSGLFTSQAVTINIADVAPIFSSGISASVAEGISTSTIVYTAAAIEPGGSVLTYSLSGTDALDFNINATTGAITFINSPNFEAKSSYNINVTATEISGLFTTQAVNINILDVAPTFSSSNLVSIPEGISTSTVVYQAQAIEPGGAALTYSLSGADASAFNINAATGAITFINSPNFEAKSSYNIDVTATEISGLFTTQAVTINIADVAPIFSSGTSASVAEGISTSTVVYTAAAIEPGGNALTYSLSGADAAAFNINAATGAITFINSPNYEAKSSYNINVSATEVSGLFTTQAITINITDVAPIFSSASTVSIPEGISTSTVVYLAQASEPGGAALTYSLSGADAAEFNINAATGAITFINSPNYEAKSNYNIDITATEASGLASMQAVTINITDLAPIFSSPASITVAEGISTSTIVYNASAIEPGGATVTYSIVSGGDASAFSINSSTGAITFNAVPNYEVKNSYSFTVQATEASGLFTNQNVTINISDVAPAISSPSTVSIPEGIATSTTVYTATASEPGGGSLTYSLSGTDAAAFNINTSTGAITFINSPIYEVKNSYNVNVIATEASGLSNAEAVTINIIDVAPTFSSPSVVSVPEGTSTSTIVYTASAIEPGGGVVTYSLVSGNDSSAFSINSSTGAVTFNAIPNFEVKNSYQFTVQATEASGLSSTQLITINVADIEPTFSSPTAISIPEGISTSTIVYTANAQEPGGGVVTYSLVAGNDSAAFSINSSTGAITFNAVPNFEVKNNYTFTVQATEASGLFTTQAVTINITDVAPTFSSPSSITVAEGTPITANIYTASAIEPGGGTITYSLINSGDASYFSINASTGAINFNAVPSYELKNTYQFTVQATEASGLSSTQSVTINITDVAPTFSSPVVASVPEGTSISTIIYTAQAIEPGGGALTYSLNGTDAAAFNINAATGAVTFINAPIYETKNSYSINVTATESSGLATTQNVNINIIDVAPTFSSSPVISVPEGTSTNTTVYTATAVEPGGSTITYSLVSGGDASNFSINASTGAVTFNSVPNYEVKNSYSFTVQATEATGLSSTQVVTINIMDVPPVFLSPTTVSVPEGISTTTAVYIASAQESGGGAVTYSLVSGGDASDFSINASTGAVSFNSIPSYEMKNSYSFTVQATEASGISSTQGVTINITDVAPVITSPTSISVPEGTSSSIIVYTAQAIEPGGGEITYSLVNTGDYQAFNINSSTGAIYFINSPNFEVKNSYTITVQATENNGVSISQVVDINITDITPVFTSPPTVAVPEGTAASTVVYVASAVEPGGGTVTYSIDHSGDFADFSINSVTGAISINSAPNYQAKSSYNFTVIATEASGSLTSQPITVYVEDLPPVFTSSPSLTVPEGTSTSTVIYTATAFEPGGGTLTYSLAGKDAADFTINSQTGQITFINSPVYSHQSIYQVSVIANELSGVGSIQPIQIDITPVSQPVTPTGAPGAPSAATANAAALNVNTGRLGTNIENVNPSEQDVGVGGPELPGLATFGIKEGTATTFTFEQAQYNVSGQGVYGVLYLNTATGEYLFTRNNVILAPQVQVVSENFFITIASEGKEINLMLTIKIYNQNKIETVISADYAADLTSSPVDTLTITKAMSGQVVIGAILYKPSFDGETITIKGQSIRDRKDEKFKLNISDLLKDFGLLK